MSIKLCSELVTVFIMCKVGCTGGVPRAETWWSFRKKNLRHLWEPSKNNNTSKLEYYGKRQDKNKHLNGQQKYARCTVVQCISEVIKIMNKKLFQPEFFRHYSLGKRLFFPKFLEFFEKKNRQMVS